MTAKRYYAARAEAPPRFLPTGTRLGFAAWLLFDRDWTDRQGEVQAIALFGTRRDAYKARNALNEMETRK